MYVKICSYTKKLKLKIRSYQNLKKGRNLQFCLKFKLRV